MIPAYNKMRCAAFPFETGIHLRRKPDFFPEEDTTKSYSGFELEPTRLQAEGHSHHTGWVTILTWVLSRFWISMIMLLDEEIYFRESKEEK
ncbi:hypothetical protein TNCV_2689781 [Trichonephila clavipes]|uniref:Uncharacterized protein n=1 Tax=Trichonephila clavipes TaxID=2585209 RepID=A0A8X6VY89_TRICX|nr:hypothetical protein TNCV_2689781 [Trichonephila clavipes]